MKSIVKSWKLYWLERAIKNCEKEIMRETENRKLSDERIDRLKSMLEMWKYILQHQKN